MPKPLNILLVEDSEDDALLLVQALKRGGYEPACTRVLTAAAMRTALGEDAWDVILCDFRLPQFNGLAAIALLKETGLDIPLIIVSGAIGEETAVECMRCGANDYVMKGNLSRLCPAIDREIKEAESRRQRKQAEENLALQAIRTQALLDLHLMANEPQQAILDFTLEAAQQACTSQFSFIGLLDETESFMTIHAWSKDAMARCASADKPIHFPIAEAGVWGDCVRRRSPVTINDYAAPRPSKKGYPEGHVPIRRFLGVPIFDGPKIAAVAAVANKKDDYMESDVRALISLANKMWEILRRKRSDEALLASESKYRSIVENALEGIYQSTPEGRFITANAAFARMAGYDSPADLIESITDSGTQLYKNPEDRKRFLEIMARQDMVDRFETEFYRKDGSRFWVVFNARAVRDDQGQVLYYEGLIENITPRKQAEEQLRRTLDSLRKAFSTTVQVLVAAVETRDPYTAGHQLRSADLARAIAQEMGIPQEKIDGLRMAGTIHDIGKLGVPAEILSKPTKLSDIEFSLIKEHAQKGFEMLKDVESPWPLAEIVHQHHERMDGSGYPRHLKGTEILPEARILAVADVVESMASHRPYRPSLGLDAALAEIENHKGTLYDAEAVEACLRLFREKGFQFQS